MILRIGYLSAIGVTVAALVPFMSAQVHATGIKIQPQLKIAPKVKIQPRVAKPKVRVKPRVKVQPRVKVEPKLVVKPRIKPAVKPNLQAVKPRVKPTVKPKLQVTRPRIAPAQAQEIALSTPKPSHKLTRPAVAKQVKPKVVTPALPVRPSDVAAAPQLDRKAVDARAGAAAAAAAEAARTAAPMAKLRDGATAKLGLASPNLAGNGPVSNRERLGGAPEVAGKPSFGFGDRLDGASSIPGPANSHNRDAPHSPFAVTPESVAEGAAGVAGQRTVRLPNVKEVDDQFSTTTNGRGVSSYDTLKRRPDGSTTLVHEENDILAGRHTRQVIERAPDGTITEDTGPQPVGSASTAPAPAELRNPDYVGGGDNCWGIDCVVNPGQPEGALTKDSNVNRVIPAPDNANPERADTAPMVNQDDLLSKYDPDGRSGGSGSPLRLEDVCMHSEC